MAFLPFVSKRLRRSAKRAKGVGTVNKPPHTADWLLQQISKLSEPPILFKHHLAGARKTDTPMESERASTIKDSTRLQFIRWYPKSQLVKSDGAQSGNGLAGTRRGRSCRALRPRSRSLRARHRTELEVPS